MRRSARDFGGAVQAFRDARVMEGGADPSLRQLLGTVILEWEQSGQRVGAQDANEGAQLFVSLAEEYPGEHGLSYSLCALELEPGPDRAVLLAMYYADQLGRPDEAAARGAGYVGATPNGPLATRTLWRWPSCSVTRFLPPPAPRPARSTWVAPAHRQSAPAGAAAGYTPPPAAPAAAVDFERGRGAARASAGLGAQGSQERRRSEISRGARARGVEHRRDRLSRAVPEAAAQIRGAARSAARAATDDGIDMEQRIARLREAAGLPRRSCATPTGPCRRSKSCSLDPESEDARSTLKRLLERAGRWDDLARVLEQEAELIADVEARITAEKGIARLHEQKRKDPVGAGEAWTRIAALVPEDDSALETAIEFFERGERPDRAAQAISDALPSVSNDDARAGLLDKLGDLRLVAGEALPAGEAFAESAAIRKDGALWLKAEKAFAQAEVWEQAASAADERAELADRPSDKAKLYAIEATYLTRAGDEAGAVERLEQATELDPIDEDLSEDLEERYEAAERIEDMVAFFLRRAGQLPAGAVRSSLRRRAADMQRDRLGDGDGARETLLALLEDGDDLDALGWLADDAEQRGESGAAADFLGRLSKATQELELKIAVLLREAEPSTPGRSPIPSKRLRATSSFSTISIPITTKRSPRSPSCTSAPTITALRPWRSSAASR